MNRLHYVNLAGVVALALLCVAQWETNRQLNHEVNRLEKLQLDQRTRLAEQSNVVRGLTADLAQFKEHYAQTEEESSAAREKLRENALQLRLRTAECDQLKASITNWAAAVEVRDERLKEANAEIRKLADELNASIGKFNELATNYNQIVRDLNALRTPEQPK